MPGFSLAERVLGGLELATGAGLNSSETGPVGIRARYKAFESLRWVAHVPKVGSL